MKTGYTVKDVDERWTKSYERRERVKPKWKQIIQTERKNVGISCARIQPPTLSHNEDGGDGDGDGENIICIVV